LVNNFLIFIIILFDDDKALKYVQLPDDKNNDGSST